MRMEDTVSENQSENETENTQKEEGILTAHIKRYNDSKKFCLQLINEFLQSYELGYTLTSFNKECTDLGFIVPPTTKKDRIKKQDLLNILEYFAEKDLKKFFDAWEKLVPSSIQQKFPYKKLTFFLHVHFAVLPLRIDGEANLNSIKNEAGDAVEEQSNKSETVNQQTQNNKPELERSEGMEVLRTFLETKGTEFSGEPEFLPYYALPFVSKPADHPSFKDLFTENWVNQLKNNLEDFVMQHSWGPTVAPQLLQICMEYRYDAGPKCRTQLRDTRYNLKQLKKRYQKLHKDHHNLIGVAAELTGALENSVKGQTVDLKQTLNNCTKIFPDLFTQQQQDVEGQPEIAPEEIIRRSISQSHDDHAASGFDLDFRRIKHHLAYSSVKCKLLLFQALRWRITQSSLEDRDIVVSSYFRHDLLGLHSSSTQPSADQLPLYAHFNPTHATTPHPLQQAAARLINTLASLRCGRDYLCSAGSGLLRILVPCLRGDKDVKMDTITSDMILATLQKLSLRHNQRVAMIEMGLVEWLVQRLNADSSSMKAYTLEYSTALLMNLCLHRRAKERCIPLAKMVLKLLTGLLGTDTTQAIPYVNGTLYSLLAHPQLNQEAKRMGLCGILEFYLKQSEGEMAKQLEYILKLHRGDCQPDQSSTSDEENTDDDTEEVDLLEEELDSEDPVRSLHGELCGEQLLYQQYRLVFPYHGVVHPSTSSTNQSAGDLLLRPTTPRMFSLGGLEAKCTSATSCGLVRPATSPELRHIESKETEEEAMETDGCETLLLESLDKGDEDEDDDDEEEEDQSNCGSTADSKPTDSQEAVADDDKAAPSQPSATSEDG